ncbi:MAG: hypothetical protein IKA95_03890 [Clostridia bacterium]|nr:hypothetical protein [Clostridia bacterium]
MKTYVKPTVDVVELSVKENIAVLPTPVTGGTLSSTYYANGSQNYVETVYDLTKTSSSAINNA